MASTTQAQSGSPSLLKDYFDITQPTGLSLLQHLFIGKTLADVPVSLNDAVVIGLDTEWWERDSTLLTELGISIIDVRNIRSHFRPWDILKLMQVYHVRIQENAHKLNKGFCKGEPDKFQFGKTRFMSKAEAAVVLVEVFTPKNADGTLRPVIFLGHAVSNDSIQIKNTMGVDMHAIGSIVRKIDTQKIATNAQVFGRGPQMSLENIIGYFDIKEQFLHTAVNDVAYTNVAAILLAFKNAGPTQDPFTFQESTNKLKVCVRKAAQLTRGTTVFCTRCDSTVHMIRWCRAVVRCQNCYRSGDARRMHIARTHKTEKCGWN
jgi:hypothetical protein